MVSEFFIRYGFIEEHMDVGVELLINIVSKDVVLTNEAQPELFRDNIPDGADAILGIIICSMENIFEHLLGNLQLIATSFITAAPLSPEINFSEFPWIMTSKVSVSILGGSSLFASCITWHLRGLSLLWSLYTAFLVYFIMSSSASFSSVSIHG